MSDTPLTHESFPLDRLTTIRIGGPADHYAEPENEGDLVALLAWAAERDLPLGIVGSGSNLLVADSGFRGLVLKLKGSLTKVERVESTVECGGGARLPSVSAKVAGWGLSGLEFGVNIPGTVGGAVRMNANAYGGELGRVLTRVDICTAAGVREAEPGDLGFSYRNSNLGQGEVVSRAWFSLSPGEVEEIKQTMAEMRGRRKEAQPSGIKTFGSTFVNPDDERAGGQSAGMLLDQSGCRGLTVGGARLSEKHANFVENFDSATASDVLKVMSAARHLVHAEFGVILEPEVQTLGEIDWPTDWEIEE
jgi:UDP-N-acetylenolpyruvoylglucosamine reductase